VLVIEQAAYEFPWTRGNFIDSLAARYLAEVLVAESGAVGYFVAMGGLDEMHLLNLTVAPGWQGQGHGRALLDALVGHCRTRGARTLWLEVRESNLRARAIYTRYGFGEVGLRRGYYPAPHGQREHAVVMSLEVAHVD
jgi:ribosomal-protein-alanine N-acetyltransferase